MRKQVLAVTIGVLLALSLLSVLPMSVRATTLFSDGFETGDYSVWTSTVGSPTINTTFVHGGTYSMKTSGVQYANKTFGSVYNDLYVQCYVYFESLPPNVGYGIGIIQIVPLSHPAYDTSLVAYRNDTGVVFRCSTDSGQGPITTVDTNTTFVQTGIWYNLELHFSITTNSTEFWVNGVLKGTLGSQYYAADAVYVGAYENALSKIAFYDDIIIADAYIGTGSDTSPPTYSNLAVNTTKANAPALFSVYASDDSGLSGYVFGTNTTGTFTNETWTAFSTNPSWANITKTLNSTIGNRITYQYWFNDTSNNNATTGFQSFITSSDASPTYSTISVSTTAAGASSTFSCLMADDLGLSRWMFGTNNSGTWTNDSSSWTNFSGNPAWANSTKTLNTTANYYVSYEWWFNDTSGNYVNTGVQAFQLSASIYNLTITATPINVGYTINSTSLGGYSFVAASGNSSDIQAAVNNVRAQGNGTVYVPAGNYTFNINTTYNMTLYTNSYVGVLGYPGVNIIGAGINQTVLILNYSQIINNKPIANMTIYMFGFVRQNLGDNAPMRISGISFIGHVGAYPSGTLNEPDWRCITLNSITDFRVDNCYFQDWGSCAIEIFNNAPYGQAEISRGVIDHCSIDNPYRDAWLPHNSSAPQPWALWGYGIIIVGNWYNHGGTSWDPNIADYLGNYYPTTTYGGIPVPQPIYIENCNFSRTRHAIAGNDGAYYVARYDYFDRAFYGQCDAHGSGSYAGTRGIEVYGCTFNLTDESYSLGQDSAIEPRGGGGVAWNNTVILNPSYGAPTIQFVDGASYPYDIENWYVWNNTAMWTNGTSLNFNSRITPSIYVENVNYFLRQPDMTNDSFTYTPYTYPHPFTASSLTSGNTNSSQIVAQGTYLVTVPSSAISGGLTYIFSQWQDASTNTTLTVALSANTTVTATYTLEATVVLVYVAPLNQTYHEPTIPVDFYASGGTIDKTWFNVKNASSWIYTNNQTFTTPVNITGFVDGTVYTFVGYANNTLGTVGTASVMFSVQIILTEVGTSLIVNVWWGNFW